MTSGLAAALGVDRSATADLAAEYLLRQANVVAFGKRIPIRTAEWLVLVATELHAWCQDRWATKPLDEIATSVAGETIMRLHRVDAPTVLGLIAPNQMVPACRAGDIDKACRALVARHLPGFCRTVLDTWENDHQLPRRHPETWDLASELASFE